MKTVQRACLLLSPCGPRSAGSYRNVHHAATAAAPQNWVLLGKICDVANACLIQICNYLRSFASAGVATCTIRALKRQILSDHSVLTVTYLPMNGHRGVHFWMRSKVDISTWVHVIRRHSHSCTRPTSPVSIRDVYLLTDCPSLCL